MTATYSLLGDYLCTTVKSGPLDERNLCLCEKLARQVLFSPMSGGGREVVAIVVGVVVMEPGIVVTLAKVFTVVGSEWPH